MYRVGEWNYKVQELSSNYKEFRNLVEAVRHLCNTESLQRVQLFLFMDNTTVEGCFYNGTSKSRNLFNLVLDLRALEVLHSLHLFVIHIAGTRMIECGVNSLSRGDLDKGCCGEALRCISLLSTYRHSNARLTSWSG